MKLRKYVCDDCHNQFWVDDDMDNDEVVRCPYCYVEVGRIDNLKITLTIPDDDGGG